MIHLVQGCVLGFWSTVDGVAAYVPIFFEPDIHSTAVQRNLDDGSIIQVVGQGLPDGEWSIAQCGRDYADHPTPAQSAALCAPSIPVSPDRSGAFATDLIVHDPLTSPSGDEVPCGYTSCVVILSDESGSPVSNIAISFGSPMLTVTPTEGIHDGATTEVEVFGAPAGGIQLRICRLPLGPTAAMSHCTGLTGGAVWLDRWGHGTASPQASAIFGETDCYSEDCAFVLFEDDDDGSVLDGPVPLTFVPQRSPSARGSWSTGRP